MKFPFILHPSALILLVTFPFSLFTSAQTKSVLKTISTNGLTENLVVPSGRTLTINAGGTITNNGTATGFSSALTVGTSTITSGTNGYALYNNNGTLGELNLTALYQPLDSDLTAIAALTTNAFGRSLLQQTSGDNVRTLIGASGSSNPIFTGQIVINTDGMSSPSVTLNDGTFAVQIYADSLTDNRIYSWPDNAGTVLLSDASSLNASNIASGSLALARIAQGGATSGQALAWNGSAWSPATVGVSDGDKGDITVASSGASWTIDTGAVSNDDLAGSISASKITGTAAILGANSFTDAQTVAGNSLGTTTAARLALANTTAAAAGAQQVSPSLVLEGQGWKTTATAASQSVRFWQNVLPVQGSTAPSGTWRLMHEINASGSLVESLSVTNAGVMSMPNGLGGAMAEVLSYSGSIVSVGGSSTVRIGAGGAALVGYLYPNNSTSAGAITSDGTGNVALRGYYAPTTAQEFSIYNTDSGSNDELAKIGWRTTSNEFTIETAKTGTGSARAIVIKVNGTSYLKIDTDGDITLPNLRTTAGATGEVYSNSGVLTLSP